MTARSASTAPRAARDSRARRRQEASTSSTAFIRPVLNSLTGLHPVSLGQQGGKNAIPCQSRPLHPAASPSLSCLFNRLRRDQGRSARQRYRYENTLDVVTFATFRVPRSLLRPYARASAVAATEGARSPLPLLDFPCSTLAGEHPPRLDQPLRAYRQPGVAAT